MSVTRHIVLGDAEQPTQQPTDLGSASGISPPAVDTVTVLRSRGKRMTKRWLSDGSIEAAEPARIFTVAVHRVSGLGDLHRILNELHADRNCFVIRGALKSDAADIQEAKLPEWNRELSSHGKPPLTPGVGRFVRRAVLFDDNPHRWVMFDIDGYEPTVDPIADPKAAIDEFIEEKLPAAFRGKSYCWQLSSSAGHTNNAGLLKAHVWFWLRTPASGEQLRMWAASGDFGVDAAVFRTVQPHYTAAPIFADGVEDPIGCRAGFVDMSASNDDAGAVNLVLPERVATHTVAFVPQEGGSLTKEQIADVRDALTKLDADDRETWIATIMNGKRQPQLYEVIRKWSETSDKHTDREFSEIWAGSGGDRSGYRSIFVRATERSWKNPQRARATGSGGFMAAAEDDRVDTERDLVGRLLSGIEEVSCEAEAVGTVTAALAYGHLDSAQENIILKAVKAKFGTSIVQMRGVSKSLRANARDERRGLGAKSPGRNAEAFIADLFTADGVRTLQRWQGQYYSWTGRMYVSVSDEDIRATLHRYFEDNGFRVESRAPIDNTLDSLKAKANVSSTTPMPAWLDGESPVPLSEVIVVGNGLLHVPSKDLIAHTPRLFSTHAVGVSFDPDAPRPGQWLAFLDSVFPADPDSVKLVQEWFGYCLTHETSMQKGLLMVGRKRSGKGTIGRVLESLIGARDFCGPSLASLGTPFGLQQLIGKGVAFIGDARMTRNADSGAISGALLPIMGEDKLSVPRKHMPDWEGKLPTRFVLASNTIPTVVDSGGALASRFVVLSFRQSFYGREDIDLFSRLSQELPGILNWAIEGRERLLFRGAFIQPESGRAALRDAQRAMTPMLAFIEDEVIVDEEGIVAISAVYARYREWHREEAGGDGRRGYELHRTPFGREFREQCEALKEGTFKVPCEGRRMDAYRGVRLRDRAQDGAHGFAGGESCL